MENENVISSGSVIWPILFWTDGLHKQIIDIFRSSRNNYGTCKIKKELASMDITTSRRRIRMIMKQEGPVSNYTKAQFRPQKDTCNESKIQNVVDRQFTRQSYKNIVVSDFAYVRVGAGWNYICMLVDLFNREIIGCSAGKNNTAALVKQAFQSVKGILKEIRIFHTNQGNEFKNKVIEEMLETFEIQRSLSRKGCPYDNAFNGCKKLKSITIGKIFTTIRNKAFFKFIS